MSPRNCGLVYPPLLIVLVTLAVPFFGLHPSDAFLLPVATRSHSVHPNEPTGRLNGPASPREAAVHGDVARNVKYARRNWCSSGLSAAAAAAAQVVRGGCSKQRKRRGAKRPLTRFFAPALVWAFAGMVDYNIWWRLAPAAAAFSRGIDKPLLGCAYGGRLGEAFAANRGHFVYFHVLLVLALLSHIAVTVSDPGFLPHKSSTLVHGQVWGPTRWCNRCSVFKPPRAHHCRRCGACIARMDHHCIYAANCIGVGNYKQFLLLLVYSAICTGHANFLCFRFMRCLSASRAELPFPKGMPPASKEAVRSFMSIFVGEPFTFHPLGVTARVLFPALLLVAFAWLIALLTVQLHGIAVDAGTVDRMQAKSKARSSEEASGAGGVLRTTEQTWWGEQAVPSCKDSSPLAEAKHISGNTVDKAVPSEGKAALMRLSSSSVSRPTPAEEGFPNVVILPRRDAVGRAADTAVSGVNGDTWFTRLRVFASWVRCFWRTFRKEILGDGPSIMWIVPLPAKLAPKIEERLYGSQHGRRCDPNTGT